VAKKLFIPAPPQRWEQAASAGGHKSTIDSYFWGYYEAGNILADACLTEASVADELFYPACFNYRHYVELTLKYLIQESVKLSEILDELGALRGKMDPDACSGLLGIHSLERLLRLLEEHLVLVSEEPFPNDVRALILELHNIDPDGQVFRYPTRTKGRPSFPSSVRYDLNAVKEGMHKVHGCLLGIDGWLDHTRDIATDYLGALQSELGDRQEY
jgi:HEPN domain-containing protein